MKCYISGKITGRHIDEYTANFEKAKQEVIALGWDPVSPIEIDHDHDKQYNSYLKEDLKAMLECNHVYAMNDWEDSIGATVELNLAKMLGIPITYQK